MFVSACFSPFAALFDSSVGCISVFVSLFDSSVVRMIAGTLLGIATCTESSPTFANGRPEPQIGC